MNNQTGRQAGRQASNKAIGKIDTQRWKEATEHDQKSGAEPKDTR